MTDKCRKQEKAHPRSFNNAFFKMGIKVENWKITKSNEQKTTAYIITTTILSFPNGAKGHEPMRFRMLIKNGIWWLDDIG